MAVTEKEIRYTKKFLSTTEWENVGYNGSDRYIPHQAIDEEYLKLIKNILKKFAIKSEINPHYYWEKEAYGFDGEQHYSFSFGSNFPEQQEEDKEKNVNYFAYVDIKKAGALEKISKNCDLEEFLLKEDFKKEESC